MMMLLIYETFIKSNDKNIAVPVTRYDLISAWSAVGAHWFVQRRLERDIQALARSLDAAAKFNLLKTYSCKPPVIADSCIETISMSTMFLYIILLVVVWCCIVLPNTDRNRSYSLVFRCDFIRNSFVRKLLLLVLFVSVWYCLSRCYGDTAHLHSGAACVVCN